MTDLREQVAAEIENAAKTFYGPSETPLDEVVSVATDAVLAAIAAAFRAERERRAATHEYGDAGWSMLEAAEFIEATP